MAGRPLTLFPIRGTRTEGRYALGWLLALVVVCGLTLIHPAAGRTSWLLEVTPGLLMVAALGALFPKLPMSRLVYTCVFFHVLILIYGGYYTYANTPLGNWAKAAFHFKRNHYDRIGHLALGLFPALIMRELLLRTSPLKRGAWLSFIVVSIVFAIGAFWELLEWWTALLTSPDVGDAFLGTQGDVWDTQWDMFLVLIGAVLSTLLLQGVHDRSMRALFARARAGAHVSADALQEGAVDK